MRSVTLVIFVGLLFGALHALPEMVTPLPGLELTPEEQRAFRERLEAFEARHQAVDDLMTGRQTLSETTERFRKIAVTHPEVMPYLRFWYPGCSDDQLIHRQILAYGKHWVDVRDRDSSPLEETKREIEILETKESAR